MRERSFNVSGLILMAGMLIGLFVLVACSEIGDISSGSGSSAENQPNTEITANPEATAEGGSCKGDCPKPTPTPRPT